MDLESVVNVAHYVLWEKRGAKVWRRAQRTRQGWQASLRAWCAAYRAWTPARVKETRPMPTEVEKQAMYRAMLPQLDQEFVALLRAELRDSLLEELMPEAEAKATAALEEAFERRREALEDRYARLRGDVERDALEEVDRRLDREREVLQQEYRDRTENLRTERTALKSRAEAAEGLVADLFQQLCGGTDRKVYLRSGGRGVERLDKPVANAILARAGLQLRSRQTFSERLVAVRLAADKVEGHTLFWLTSIPPAGVEREPDGDESGAETTGIPEGTGL